MPTPRPSSALPWLASGASAAPAPMLACTRLASPPPAPSNTAWRTVLRSGTTLRTSSRAASAGSAASGSIAASARTLR
ncbi:MAG: hypothetical protein U1F67_11210 [Rubrivivax sp.]